VRRLPMPWRARRPRPHVSQEN